jgi:hypothetical protein
VAITGSYSATSDIPRIQVVNANVTITLQGVSLNCPKPFISSHSNITIISSASNLISSTGQTSAGIGCSDFSNLTFLSFSNTPLNIQITAGSVGIGAFKDGQYDRLRFINGNYSVLFMGSVDNFVDSTGIGSGSAYESNTHVDEILIEDGTYDL